jgi:uncharacterized protein (DUF849 family)
MNASTGPQTTMQRDPYFPVSPAALGDTAKPILRERADRDTRL